MPPHPKRKLSKGRRDRRRAHDALQPVHLVKCKQCGSMRLPHHACPDCGKDLIIRYGRYGKFIACSGFPACRHTEAFLQKIGVICPKDGGEIAERKTRKERVAAALEEGKAFLAENAKKEGVVTLASGLQYKVIQEGTGKSPMPTDNVTVQYKGTLIDGTEFDSSYKRGESATFPVNGVIKGWVEALQLMKVGDKWQLFVPPDLGYAERGAPPVIGPNATLVFEVELLAIK